MSLTNDAVDDLLRSDGLPNTRKNRRMVAERALRETRVAHVDGDTGPLMKALAALDGSYNVLEPGKVEEEPPAATDVIAEGADVAFDKAIEDIMNMDSQTIDPTEGGEVTGNGLGSPLPTLDVDLDPPTMTDRLKASGGYYDGDDDDNLTDPPEKTHYGLAVVESPFAGDIQRNTAYARLALKDSLDRGEAPFASHLLYTQVGVLDDSDPVGRGKGILAGLEWGYFADVCAVYQDLGVTSGMGLGIAAAMKNDKPIEYRNLPQDVMEDFYETYGKPE